MRKIVIGAVIVGVALAGGSITKARGVRLRKPPDRALKVVVGPLAAAAAEAEAISPAAVAVDSVVAADFAAAAAAVVR